MLKALVEVKNAKEGRRAFDILHLETVRMRDLQETLPIYLQIKRQEI